MKTVKKFEEAGDCAREYIEELKHQFLEREKELVAKVTEPLALAILAQQVGVHMGSPVSHEVSEAINSHAEQEPIGTAIHELRRQAGYAAAAWAPGFIRMFGSVSTREICPTLE